MLSDLIKTQSSYPGLIGPLVLGPCFLGEADVSRNGGLVGLSGPWGLSLLPSGPGAKSLPRGARLFLALEFDFLIISSNSGFNYIIQCTRCLQLFYSNCFTSIVFFLLLIDLKKKLNLLCCLLVQFPKNDK